MPQIIHEVIVPWTVNGNPQSPFLCTPVDLQELGYGHLYTQYRLQPEDILSVTETAGTVTAQVRDSAACRYISTADRITRCAPLQSDFTVSRAELAQLCSELLSDEEWFGTHRMVLRSGAVTVFREDIGRHNAADKLIGNGLQHGTDLSRAILGGTGRISLEMLAKCASAGIPVFFSAKYPSDLAIAWADQLNIALVARAHKPDAQVYGAAWRIR